MVERLEAGLLRTIADFRPKLSFRLLSVASSIAATRRGVTMNLVFVNPVFVVVAPEMNATQASDPGRRRRMSDLRNPIGLRSTSIAKIKSVAINQFT